MKRSYEKIILFTSLMAFLVSVACKRGNEAKERVQAERAKWEASLPDSLKSVERQTDSIRNEIQALTDKMDTMLPEFNYIDNPREVEGYYIAASWVSNYPLKSTGLVARLTKNEKLELIAALSGGAHFNRLRIEAGGQVAETSIVAHDQALNYRMTGLNTVCFYDSAANSCAKLIAENPGSDIKIVFLEGDKKTGTLNYPTSSQAVMASTWHLYETRSAMLRNERLIPLLARKAAVLTSKIEALQKK